jgi:hypothetical protein
MAEKLSPKEIIARDASKYFGSSSPASLYEFAKIHGGSYIDPKLNAEMTRILKETTPETKKESMRGEKQLRELIDKEGVSRSTSGKLTSGGGRGSAGGGGMNPADIEKVPGKRQLKFKSGGSVKSSASKRADGCAVKGKTKGKMV